MHMQPLSREKLLYPEIAAPALRGRRLALAWGGLSVLVALQLALFVAAIPAYFAQLSAPPAAVRSSLSQLGISTGLYAAYLTAVIAAFSLVCFCVAALVAWHRRDEVIALVASLLLVLMGSVNAPNASALEASYPNLVIPVETSVFLLLLSLILLLFMFPDGRLVPRWTWFWLLPWAAVMLAGFVGTGMYRATSPPGWFWVVLLGGFGAGVLAQIYRYLRVSNRVQRQQTKWVVLGMFAALSGQLVFGLLTPLFSPFLSPPGFEATPYDLVSVTAVTFSYLLIPVSMGVAILKYRLWDIDVVVNRTLVYGALTAVVAGLYVLVVGALGTLLQARGNLLLSLLATGLVAVLFTPLRDRLQRSVDHLMYGERDDPYGVISRLGQRLEGTLAPEAVLPAVAETVAHALKLPYVAIALKREHGYDIVAEHGSPTGAMVSLPLVYGADTVGCMSLAPRSPGDTFSSADRRLLDDLARQAGVAAHAVRLTADLHSSNENLRAARERLVTAREEERRRLRRDLHDGLGPQLAGFTLRIDAARNLLRQNPDAADGLLEDLGQRTQAAVTDIRRLVYGLRPPALDDLGLVGALRQQAAQYAPTGLSITVEAPESLPPLPAAVEAAAYRITQEALTNVVRHSGASACVVRIALEDALHLEIADNGRGFDEGRRAGVGLASMRERSEELGGTFAIESERGTGTTVRALLPLTGVERRE